MHWQALTKIYVARANAEGRTKPEIMRCLKRYLARQVYRCLVPRVLLHPAVNQALDPHEDLTRAA